MPFKQVFERNVNDDMQPPNPDHEAESADIKKDFDAASSSTTTTPDEDYEISEKKDHPPRFSTLFEGSKAPTPVIIESQALPPRKSGVYLAKSTFAILMIVLLLESTFLFAYTVIGLYNNTPSRFLTATGIGPAPIGGSSCNCGDSQKQPAINIAPNFIMPGAGQPINPLDAGPTVPYPVPADDSSSMEAAAASNVMSIISSLLPTTTTSTSSSTSRSSGKVLTVTPPVPVTTHTNVITTTPSATSTSVNN